MDFTINRFSFADNVESRRRLLNYSVCFHYLKLKFHLFETLGFIGMEL